VVGLPDFCDGLEVVPQQYLAKHAQHAFPEGPRHDSVSLSNAARLCSGQRNRLISCRNPTFENSILQDIENESNTGLSQKAPFQNRAKFEGLVHDGSAVEALVGKTVTLAPWNENCAKVIRFPLCRKR
jgi:hypothetical protein